MKQKEIKQTIGMLDDMFNADEQKEIVKNMKNAHLFYNDESNLNKEVIITPEQLLKAINIAINISYFYGTQELNKKKSEDQIESFLKNTSIQMAYETMFCSDKTQ